jgi:hypothetical protein
MQVNNVMCSVKFVNTILCHSVAGLLVARVSVRVLFIGPVSCVASREERTPRAHRVGLS